MVEVKDEIGDIVNWLRDYLDQSPCSAFVIGLSGGVDSAVAFALCLRTGKVVHSVFIGIESSEEDKEHAKLVWKSQKPDKELRYIQLTSTYLGYCRDTEQVPDSSIPRQNVKARLRMIALYNAANLNHALVVGTDNKCESVTGFFTKFGDGAYDINPLGEFLKSEVREMAKILDIPKEIIEKPPSPGLSAGQTDEDDMGVTYEEIEDHILEIKYSPKVAELHKANLHKLKMPPVFKRVPVFRRSKLINPVC